MVTSIVERIFRFLASLKLAVILLVGFAILLGAATFYESHSSTEAAQRLIYKSAWFDFLLFFLGVNVFCAAVSRMPWRKKHIGFVITHLGILIILVGSVITRKFGLEGQLVMQEGQTADSILIDEAVFSVSAPRLNARREFDPWFMNQGLPSGKEIQYELDEMGILCSIDEYHANPRVLEQVGENGSQPNPAIQIFLNQSDQVTGNMDEWLFVDSSSRNRLDLGMAVIEFKRAQTPEALQAALSQPANTPPIPEGQIVLKSPDGQTVQTIPLQTILEKPFSFPWNGKSIEVQFKEFIARAAVDNGKLIDRENGAINPAVRFLLTVPDSSEEHLAFAKFPDLGSFHGGETSKSGLVGQFVYPIEKYADGGNRVVIFLDAEGKLHYRAANAEGKWLSGAIALGTPFETTWPAVNLTVQKLVPNAVLTERIVDAGADAAGLHNHPVAHVRLQYNGQTVEQYVSFNQPKSIAVGGETINIEFGQKQYPLGFSIQLIDFQAPRYPGTNRPARFQSLVRLLDPEKQIDEERLIYMNNPLACNRFLIYQSGYEEGKNGEPDTSIFSVAQAPGTPVIYLGSIILCLGMIYTFATRRTPPLPSNESA